MGIGTAAVAKWVADQAAREQWAAPLQYLARLIEGESQRRHERQIARRLAAAHFQVRTANVGRKHPHPSRWPRAKSEYLVARLTTYC